MKVCGRCEIGKQEGGRSFGEEKLRWMSRQELSTGGMECSGSYVSGGRRKREQLEAGVKREVKIEIEIGTVARYRYRVKK